MRKTWMLASALLVATACGDDDDSSKTQHDASTPGDASVDAGSMDSGARDAGNMDANLLAETGPGDAEILPRDAENLADSNVTDTDAANKAPIEVLGLWTSEYDDEAISQEKWGDANLIEYDNEARTAVVFYPLGAEYGENTYSKLVWTPIVDGRFWYCFVGFNATTLESARALNMPADSSNPANGGCGTGGFPWTQLQPRIEIGGSWLQGTTPFEINSHALGDQKVESYDNELNSAITSTAAPKFGKVVWTQAAAKQLYLCFTATDLATLTEAQNDTTVADSTQLTTGCLGGPWTALTQP